MRVLIVSPPGYGHVFPVVPLAWAVRAAGHDVLVASCGVSIHAAIRAGLPAANVASTFDVAALQARHAHEFSHVFPPVASSEPPTPLPLFSELCDRTVDAVIDVARRWKATVIIYTPEAAAGLIAATQLRLPPVFLCVGLAHTPRLMRACQSTLGATMARLDLSELDEPAAWIDVTPPSLRSTAGGWQMRHIPYAGGMQVDAPATPARNGRRVAVTFGTIVPHVLGLSPLRSLINAAAQVDATFVIAHGFSHGRALEPLPPNVHATTWQPMDALLRSCDAVIHHGGFGTTMAALCEGLPQLVLPQGSDHFVNARLLREAGAARSSELALITPDVLMDLLADRRLRDTAQTLSREIAAMPSPSFLVSRLTALLH